MTVVHLFQERQFNFRIGVPEELNLGTGKPKSYCLVPSMQLVFQQGLFPGQQAKF